MKPSGYKAPDLFESVRFEMPNEVADGYGGTTTGFTPQFTERAGYHRLRGTEVVQAARLAGRQPTVITVRASSQTRQITTGWRAVDTRTDETFNITAAAVATDRRFIDMIAESGVAT